MTDYAKYVTRLNFLFFSHHLSYLNGWGQFLISIHSSVILLLYSGSVCAGLLCTIQSCLLEALLTVWRIFVWDQKGCERHCCNCFKLKRNILTSCDCVDSCFFLSCLNWRGIDWVCFGAASFLTLCGHVWCFTEKTCIGNKEICENLDFLWLTALLWIEKKKKNPQALSGYKTWPK